LDLKNIEFKVKKGNFVCIVGDVGCGKTSLLQALNGEMIYINEKFISSEKQKQQYFDKLLKTISCEEIVDSPIL
jgi:ABC-type cobalamin/Fe3+-siderophores transport system ATPase subunit